MEAGQWRKERKNAILCPNMTVEEIAKSDEFRSVVEDYRGMCFWNMAENWLPHTREEFLVAAENLEHYGDLSAYRKAGRMREWLLHAFSPTS